MVIVILGILLVLVILAMIRRGFVSPVERLISLSRAIGLNEEIGEAEREKLLRIGRRRDPLGRLARNILGLEDAIQARIREQATLWETGAAVESSLDSQIVLDRILEQVERLLNVKMIAIIARDEQHGVFRIRASRGLSKQFTEQLAIQPYEPSSVAMRALYSQEPIQVSDTETDPSYVPQRPRARAEGFRSLLAVPFNTRDAPPIVLMVFHPHAHVFSENEINLLVSFANHATMAIENAARYSLSDMRMQEQTRRLEPLVQSLSAGLILNDLKGNVVYVNRRIEELADISADQLSGAPVDRILASIMARAADPEKAGTAVKMVLDGNEDARIEIPLNISGRTSYLRLETFEVTDAIGVPLGRGIFLLDTTADSELDRMKSSLISTVSHELRTPLAAIKGYASTLLAEDVEWDRNSQREFLSIISNESDRLSNLVNNLLDLSRIEAGSLRLSREQIHLEQLIDRAAEQAHLQPDNRLEVRIEADWPPLYADRPRLEAILRNLIENSVKYAGPQAVIEVSVRQHKDEVIFRVADDGPGIPPGESQRIFDSFYRANDSLARVASGAGLGLAICQGLVRAHGGSIWVEQQKKGACIAFSIPFIGQPGRKDPRPAKKVRRL